MANEEQNKQKNELLKSIADQKNGGNQKGKAKSKSMFKDKRLNTIVNKIGLSEEVANWCISIHKKYCIWIANQIKANGDLSRREGDINLILDWKKEEQALNLNDYTFEQALEAAREAHGMNFKENNNSLKNKNVVLDLGKYKWVQLITMADCSEEGSAMGHCIGGHGHSNSISAGNTFGYSLRDEFNRPHLTLECRANGGNVFEFKGRSNGIPKAEYIECYIELSRKFADVLGQVTDYTFTEGLKSDIVLAKRLNSVNKRTIDQKTKMSLGLNMFDKGETFMQTINVGNELKKFELPDEIKIYGNLLISISGMVIIPNDIVIGGSVQIIGRSLTLGENVKVGGNCDLSGCNFRRIPKGLQVCGDLILPIGFKKKEKEIRENVIFGGRLIFGKVTDVTNNMLGELDEARKRMQKYEEK